MRVRGRENEDHVRRGFFEGFEKRGRGGFGELVHLVEDVDLPTPGCVVPGARDDVTNVVHAVVGSAVQFYDVQRRPFRDRETALAESTGVAVHGILTVEGLGENSRGRRLSGAARPRKEVGVGNSVVLHRTLERSNHVILSSKFSESGWSKAPIERGHPIE